MVITLFLPPVTSSLQTSLKRRMSLDCSCASRQSMIKQKQAVWWTPPVKPSAVLPSKGRHSSSTNMSKSGIWIINEIYFTILHDSLIVYTYICLCHNRIHCSKGMGHDGSKMFFKHHISILVCVCVCVCVCVYIIIIIYIFLNWNNYANIETFSLDLFFHFWLITQLLQIIISYFGSPRKNISRFWKHYMH